tara:strand:- start:1431 stop:2099 length:669 start_codon:yes stop_codon:yes gene_type:complete
MTDRKIGAMLFDFDGTIADTSYDMVNCLNILLRNHKKNTVNLNSAKNFISTGAGGLIDFACPNLSNDTRKIYISEYLDIYKDNIFIKTHLFSGIADVINMLISNNYKWGIVTNKPGYLVNPIIKKLNFKYQPSCIVAGDTLNVKKPNPAPLLHASSIISCEPESCIYVGDDKRDILAANSAGMISVAASYGFIDDLDKVKKWGSDYVITSPLDLKKFITHSA